MKFCRADLIKPLIVAVGLIMVITLLGQYIIPPYVVVDPSYSIYNSGIVDHKKLVQVMVGDKPKTLYAVSVRLFDDDPVNRIQGGKPFAYIVTKAEWEMVEWGDTVKIRLSLGLRAEIVGLFPTLKLPEWHGLSGSASPISIELVANKSTYKIGEKADFTVTIRNAPEKKGWAEPPVPLKLTLFKTVPFWAFRDGERAFSSPSDLETQEIVIQPVQELKFSFEWDLVGVTKGVYYVRAYLGYFADNKEITLTGTTMIGIEA